MDRGWLRLVAGKVEWFEAFGGTVAEQQIQVFAHGCSIIAFSSKKCSSDRTVSLLQFLIIGWTLVQRAPHLDGRNIFVCDLWTQFWARLGIVLTP